MIKLLGKLKGVQLKSKDEDGNVVHYVSLNLELIGGFDRVQEVIGNIKQIVEVQMENRQPTLTGNAELGLTTN